MPVRPEFCVRELHRRLCPFSALPLHVCSINLSQIAGEPRHIGEVSAEEVQCLLSEAEQNSTDIQLLNEWMNLFGTDVLNVAYSYIRNYAQAQDITQDVFLRAYKNMHQFRSESSARTWLLSITVNRCKDYLRSWHHRKVAPLEEVKPEGVQETPEQQVVHSLEKESLWNEVGKLPVKYREVLTLFYLRDLSGQEVAQVLGVSEQSVRTRLHRARKLLRNQLEGEGWNND